MHDTKNQILEIDMMVEQNRIDQIRPFIKEWQKYFFTGFHTPVCLNVYIDHILRCKIEEYPDIQFDLKLQIPEYIPMNTSDLISLFTILIDYSCRIQMKNHQSVYRLEICVKDHELEIYEKYSFDHNFKLNYELEFKNKFIKNIVNKYQGNINQISTGDTVEQSILLFLNL